MVFTFNIYVKNLTKLNLNTKKYILGSMRIVKKILPVGGSKGIIIPKIWLDSIEAQTGNPVTKVILEINGSITIKPFSLKE